jgi:tryptophanyl-tRNA synthetase
MKKIISGIQPTGTIHIGNFLGSINNWKNFQDSYECFFPIVDLHALTAEIPNPKDLKQNIYTAAAVYIASGIDPEKSIIFKQSDVSYHCELFWLLSCFTQIGKLNRMTQFKDKSGNNKEKAGLGLYSYPVLMAADILLYNTDIVPVGHDQLQHLELTNSIAASFNSKYGIEYFKKIEPYILESTKRIMSLRDGTKKMSKSEPSDMSRINITDDAELINKKIMKAKTDSIEGFKIDIENRPETKNLLNLFSCFSDRKIEDIQNEYDSLGNKKFKEDLSKLIISKIEPISSRVTELLNDTSYLDSVLASGAEKANKIAFSNIQKIKQIMGF